MFVLELELEYVLAPPIDVRADGPSPYAAPGGGSDALDARFRFLTDDCEETVLCPADPTDESLTRLYTLDLSDEDEKSFCRSGEGGVDRDACLYGFAIVRIRAAWGAR